MTTDTELRALELKKREVRALERLAARPLPKNVLQSIAEWWRLERARSMRVDY